MPGSNLRRILEGHQNLTDELEYLLRAETRIVPATLEILEASIDSLNKNERNKFFSSFGKTVKSQNICDKIYEIIVYFYLKNKGLDVEYEPNIGGKTPDLRFTVNGKQFAADVFAVNSPKKSVRKYDAEFQGEKVTLTESRDTDHTSFSRALKISDTISKKSSNYSPIGLPLVLFAFIRDRNALDLYKFENAMYGVSISEFEAETSYPGHFVFDRRQGRAILSPECKPQLKNLSALVGVEIFDTLNKSDPGKRFQCRILHHFSPDVRFPLGVLGNFSEVTWEADGPALQWRPFISGNGELVGKVSPDFEFEYGNYSDQEPF